MPERGRSAGGSLGASAGESSAGAAGHRRTVRSELAWRLVRAVLGDQITATGRSVLDVVDAGGGTGTLAVPVAELGHHVTVVDPSPDSLAALERRAAEARVTDRIHAVQGDAVALSDIVGPASTDLVLCHSVLEVVDDPAVALQSMAEVLRTAGALSVVVANPNAVVLAKVLGGHIAEARQALTDPAGRWGAADPMPRRFTVEQLRDVVEQTGLQVVAEHGLRVFADLVPGALSDEPGLAGMLLELEAEAAEDPTFRALASQIHLLARRI
ncbi:class I SAM-dependent methyltransferase [Actinopolymorpha alba]|uniref:class I SAM-dependent methyltransferase n=1 Tax=Actinopolymorpha alba TaxID=533267 RepID=UPI000361D11F|nr:methyltransferase domain-containing protein [Actinopolymorpha alba]